MHEESAQVSRHASGSIPPLAIDTTIRISERNEGLLANVDARALTSIAALCVAMLSVVAIAIVGHVKHSSNAASITQTSNETVAPLVNEGVEIPTPAINVGRPEAAE